MARITVEDCLSNEPNRFALVMLASKRTKQLLGGARFLVEGKKGNKSVVNSLREIAGGFVRFKTAEDLEREREEALRRREAELALAEEAQSQNGAGNEDSVEETLVVGQSSPAEEIGEDKVQSPVESVDGLDQGKSALSSEPDPSPEDKGDE